MKRNGTHAYDATKERGAHYTPPDLARFLAKLALLSLHRPGDLITVLDPACGDGNLLASLLEMATSGGLPCLRVFGLDRDFSAVQSARRRLAHFTGVDITIDHANFIELTANFLTRQPPLAAGELRPNPDYLRPGTFDVVIANPPYVRTQVLGEEESQRLAATLDLSGRVDLYHAFVRAITVVLRPGGVLALICSNRFLSTRSGEAVRRTLSADYELERVIDLGDTKLFSAAVLPAVVVAKRRPCSDGNGCRYTRIYEVRSSRHHTIATSGSVIEALEKEASGLVRIGSQAFQIEHGRLARGASLGDPWFLTSNALDLWLQQLRKGTAATFGTVAHIRVGIKTTADSVFIRTDWETLPEETRPENTLLHPLLTHELARPWKPAGLPRASVLYPHENVDGQRRPVSLDRFPQAKAYLEQHYNRLSSRSYVHKASRLWYEIWVPHDPLHWSAPKLVWPDISESPAFFLDESGAIVNGDCYWATLKSGYDRKWLYLMLAVANSSFAVKLYDALFANRLYSRRRRFITQYVEKFPLPDPEVGPSRALLEIISRLCGPAGQEAQVSTEQSDVDRLVWEAFGLHKEIFG